MRRPTAIIVAVALATPALVAAQPPGGARGGQDRTARYPQMPPAVGTPAPDFELKDLDGKVVRLRDFIGKRPVVIEFGSYT